MEKDFSASGVRLLYPTLSGSRQKRMRVILCKRSHDLFIRDIVTTAERKNLETKHPEIPHLMPEYRDGILLFEVSNSRDLSKPSAQQKVLEAKWIAI